MLYKTIVFSNAPLLKGFRYRNIFQLVPFIYGNNAPLSIYASHFPLFLEYEAEAIEEKTYVEDYLKEKGFDERIVKYSRFVPNQERVKREILNLLTCLTNFRFFSYKEGSCWAVQTPNKIIGDLSEEEKSKLNKQVSHWCIPAYVYPGIKQNLEIKAFTQCSEYYTTFEDVRSYFTINPNIENNPEVKLPSNIDFCMQRYFSEKDDLRLRIKHCMGLLADGIALFDTKRSVSLLTIVSSIEGMAKIDYDLYGQENKLGAKARFVRYLKRYVAGRSEEKYVSYYKKRCGITHEGDLFLGDIDIYADPEQQAEDWLLRLEIQQVARLALYDWLIRVK